MKNFSFSLPSWTVIIYIWIYLEISSSSHWYSGNDVCRNKLSLQRKPQQDVTWSSIASTDWLSNNWFLKHLQSPDFMTHNEHDEKFHPRLSRVCARAVDSFQNVSAKSKKSTADVSTSERGSVDCNWNTCISSLSSHQPLSVWTLRQLTSSWGVWVVVLSKPDHI